MFTKEDLLYRTILIVTLIIGMIIGCFLLSVIWQQRKFRKLNIKKVEIEIDTLENERKRMAADLHDELGAVLSSMKYKLESIDSVSAVDQIQLDQCIRLAYDIIAKIRRISNALRPVTLIEKGIEFAINEYVEKVNAGSPLVINFQNTGIHQMPPACEVHIFRILLEIIHNTIKHAKAATLKIEMFTKNDLQVILTADDGIGFNYNDTLKKKKGHGLHNLQNRADLLGGELHIRSVPGEGTRCHISIPFKKKTSAKICL